MFERRNRMPMGDLLELRFAGHIIEEVANTYERVCGRVCLKEIRPSQLIFSGELGPRPQNLVYQRLSNIADGRDRPRGVVAHHAADRARGPASPRPDRCSTGRPGWGWTTRCSRYTNSARCGWMRRRRTGAVWAQKDDPRVTAVGRIIRRIRFDELPQLFNVLKGEMSIVGPRPERPEFVKAP